jgi:hypothetical protein
MILVQLKGGIGNQLFHYAAAKALATHRGVPLKLDVSGYQQDTLRGFELCNFNIDVNLATEAEVARFSQGLPGKVMARLLPHYRRSVYKEQGFHFDTHFWQSRSTVYLKGYWQSEKYFLSIQEQLRKAFMLQPALINKVIDLGKKMYSEESVAVHIRRGDYTNPAVMQVHGILPAAYYTAAVNEVSAKTRVECVYIFTDDEAWVRQHLPVAGNYQFVSNVFTSNHYEDFYLMSCCRHNIIANSSFSWWTAWLNTHPDKIVIGPAEWFKKKVFDTSDILPQQWIKL